jgi:hypothetical protein
MAAILLCTAMSPQRPAALEHPPGPPGAAKAPPERTAIARPAGATTTIAPRRLAIYYGIPSLVNGARGDVARAAAVFSEYDIVVFGDGLEFADVVPGRTPPGAGAAERLNTMAVTRALSTLGRRPAVFGYIDLGHSQRLPQREIERRVSLWREIGAAGIFYDEAGYDFGVDRPRQNVAVDAAHAAGMRVVMNAFNPDDVFVPSNGVSHRLAPGDAYLLESFAVRNGRVDDQGWSARAARAVEYAGDGIAVHAVTTTTDPVSAASGDSLAYAWWAALAYGVDGFGWGEPAFSGPDSALPWRARPPESGVGDRFVGPLGNSGGVSTRPTNRGRIELDTRRHTGRFVPSLVVDGRSPGH